MRFIAFVFIFVFTGCASVQMPDYISRVDHPYERKFYANFEKVTSAFIFVLKKYGWAISEADPSTYERDDQYDNTGYQNLLIITDVKKSNRVLYSTFKHLNVFIHSIGDSSDVEIRYEDQTSFVKRFMTAHNDKLVQGILDAVDQEINR